MMILNTLLRDYLEYIRNYFICLIMCMWILNLENESIHLNIWKELVDIVNECYAIV